MPSDLLLTSMNLVHRTGMKVTGGRWGWRFGSMPVIQLTTTGRTSGEPRTVMLTSPMQEGASMVIVASRGGDDRHPAWFLNLQANPEVRVTTRAGTTTMQARVATDDERARLWPQVTSAYRNYAQYQTKTERVIPLVFLDPA